MSDDALAVLREHARQRSRAAYLQTECGLDDARMKAAYRELVNLGYVIVVSETGHLQITRLQVHRTYRITEKGVEALGVLHC